MDQNKSHSTRRNKSADESDSVEQAAIRLCRSGDIAGLEALYESYNEQVFRTCYRILGDRAAAEDQTQEVFLRVFEKIGHFKGRSRFSTWLYRLAVNQTLNRLRSRKRRLLKTLGMDFLEELAGHDPTQDYELLQKERRDEVQAILSRLSVEHRAVLVLREIEELSYAEISEVLGIAQGTVMSRLHRARRELRSCLESRNSEQGSGVETSGEDQVRG